MILNIHIDGGARGNPGPAAAAVVIRRQDGDAALLHEAAYHLGNATNNVAEYSALIRALELAVTLKPDQVHLHSDSELMVRQITGQYRVRSPDLLPLFEKAQSLLLKLDTWQIRHVYREANRRADELANLALDAGKDVIVRSVVPGQVAHPPSTTPSVAPPVATPKAPSRRAAGALTKSTAPEDAAVRWTVTLETDPGAACPAGCRASQRFPFGPGTPPGLCIHAAQAVLGDVDLDDDAVNAAQPRQTACHRCGVKLRLEF